MIGRMRRRLTDLLDSALDRSLQSASISVAVQLATYRQLLRDIGDQWTEGQRRVPTRGAGASCSVEEIPSSICVWGLEAHAITVGDSERDSNIMEGSR